MSGHSKWSTIKRAKAATDAKRSNLFTKLSKNISIAARDGSDSDANFKLRIAIDKAKKMAMPKDNIERAIKRGSGELAGEAQLESLFYEAYGPGGVALLIEVLTDNKNRTVSNLKHLLSKAGGSLGNSGSVMWMFEPKGEIILKQVELDDKDELKIIEMGAEDILKDDEIKIVTGLEDLEGVKNQLAENNFEIDSSELVYLAKDKISPEDPEKLLNLMESLDDDDDVNNIYTNADI